MSSVIIDCTSAQDILAQLHSFLTVGHTMPGVYTGQGNGWVDDAIGTAASIYETITVTFSSATNFTVAGSISGGLGPGVVGTLFTSTVIRFTVTASTTPFTSGDTIKWQMTAPWQGKIVAPGSQYLWVAPGNDNNSVIRVGLTTASDSTGGYFNARTWMFPYWSDAVYAINTAWTAQFKAQPGPYWNLGSGSTQTARLIARADGNFCYAVAVIGTTMCAMGLGFFDSFNTRDYHPFPCLIGGSMDWDASAVPASTSTVWKWSDANVRYPLFPAHFVADQNNEYSELRLRTGVKDYDTYYARYNVVFMPEGAGVATCFQQNNAYWSTVSLTLSQSHYQGAYMRCNLDGSFPLWPILIKAGRTDRWASNKLNSVLGKYPFIGKIPPYDASGAVIVKQQIFRDPNTRRRIIAVTSGALEDAGDFYGLELA
jgi:hypothetical protein